jgi:hypothetical protein
MSLQLSESASRLKKVRRHRYHGNAVAWTFGVVFMGLACVSEAAELAEIDTRIVFSIPAQPLVSAISRYGDATGSEALYDASLATGRFSNNVQGMMTPAEALERLLIGTGLSARFVSERRFVVAASPSVPNRANEITLPPAHRRYYGLVQQGVLDTLCQLPSVRPGHYRVIVALRIAPTGGIEHVHRIGTVGAAEADQQMDGALRGVRFSEPPPADFMQPIRILLSPDAPGGAAACARADARHAASGEPR